MYIGKSMLIKGFCKKLQLPMLQLSPSSLLRKYVGESSQLTQAVFTLARKTQPMVIFIDEIDGLFKQRTMDECTVDRHLKTECK
jgi:ATPase family AAA domain-containing protein 1